MFLFTINKSFINNKWLDKNVNRITFMTPLDFVKKLFLYQNYVFKREGRLKGAATKTLSFSALDRDCSTYRVVTIRLKASRHLVVHNNLQTFTKFFDMACLG